MTNVHALPSCIVTPFVQVPRQCASFSPRCPYYVSASCKSQPMPMPMPLIKPAAARNRSHPLDHGIFSPDPNPPGPAQGARASTNTLALVGLLVAPARVHTRNLAASAVVAAPRPPDDHTRCRAGPARLVASATQPRDRTLTRVFCLSGSAYSGHLQERRSGRTDGRPRKYVSPRSLTHTHTHPPL